MPTLRFEPELSGIVSENIEVYLKVVHNGEWLDKDTLSEIRNSSRHFNLFINLQLSPDEDNNNCVTGIVMIIETT